MKIWLVILIYQGRNFMLSNFFMKLGPFGSVIQDKVNNH